MNRPITVLAFPADGVATWVLGPLDRLRVAAANEVDKRSVARGIDD